nr:cytochrome c oxidase subunit II [Mesorhizobium albiziae]
MRLSLPIFPTCLSSCSGLQSALDPAGEEAHQVLQLSVVLFCGAAAIWLGVVAALLYTARRRRKSLSEQSASRFILFGGAVLPSVTLAALLSYSLWLMPGLRPFGQAASAVLHVEVTGKQYWWHVVYRRSNGPVVVSANEIRLPVGQRVELTLASSDVIHSFWIPALGGKMDMIPGRTNRLSLLANKAGTFRGPCAEFCGTSHALMAFAVVTMEAQAFQEWLGTQARPSPRAADDGAALFLRHGCGACHAVAGIDARGTIGPDLSHLGSRLTLGAGSLPNTADAIARFITEPERIKPGVQMPSFAMLPQDDIRNIAAWLKDLE